MAFRYSSSLKKQVLIKRIKEEVCKVFGVDRAELYEIRRGFSNQPRNVAIYLLRTLRGDTLGDTLDEIGREFNMNRYSSNPPASPGISPNGM